MSSLLEQAIVDAKALKEVAIQNAERAIIEKYSDEVRSTLDQLLEQEEPAGEEVGNGDLEPALEEEIPFAHRTSDIEPQMVSIDLQQLEEEINKRFEGVLEERKSFLIAEPEVLEEASCGGPHKEDEDAVYMEEDEEEKLEEGKCPSDCKCEKCKERLEEEIELDDDLFLEEAFHLDYKTQPTGHVGAFTDSEMELAMDLEAIKEKYEDKIEHQQGIMKEAVEIIEDLEAKNKKYENYFAKLKESFAKVKLDNTKLMYTNKALMNDSLNERQKQKIAESLSSAKNEEQAKIIFETLSQNAVGSGKSAPKSLSEAVEKRSLLTVTPKRKETQETIEEAISSRWKRLAGIKN
jgi:hypothetical protein